MTHFMQGMAVLQQPGAARRGAAVVLRALSKVLDAIAARLEYTQAAPTRAVVEFEAIELGGRVMGAYYVDGELVTIVPDLTRL